MGCCLIGKTGYCYCFLASVNSVSVLVFGVGFEGIRCLCTILFPHLYTCSAWFMIDSIPVRNTVLRTLPIQHVQYKRTTFKHTSLVTLSSLHDDVPSTQAFVLCRCATNRDVIKESKCSPKRPSSSVAEIACVACPSAWRDRQRIEG